MGWPTFSQTHLGSMLYHNFLRFLTIFSEKIGVFLKNQCYDHNFLRFLTIFGEKIGVFLKNQGYYHNFCKN
jgi:hypothetical protein